MRRLVAFLRGINLGGRRVTNDELREHFEALGLEGVSPYLASGNVVFDDPGSGRAALERRVEAHLEKTLGYPVHTLVRSMHELQDVLRSDAVAGAPEDTNVYITFLRGEPDTGTAGRLTALATADDRLLPLEREIVWHRRGGIADAPITTREWERALGGPEHTRRSVNTLRRLVAKFESV